MTHTQQAVLFAAVAVTLSLYCFSALRLCGCDWSDAANDCLRGH